MMPTYATPPTPQTGLALNAARGWVSVLIPIARTNEIMNQIGRASCRERV